MVVESNKKWWWCAVVPLLFAPANTSLSGEIAAEVMMANYVLKLRPFVKVDGETHHPKTFCYYEKAGVPANESIGQIIANSPSSAEGLSVKWVKAIRNLSEAGCDMFYIPSSESNDIDNILTSLGTSSTLTISNADRFILHGGMLGFVIDNENHVRMAANLENLRKRGIWVDSQILEIMQEVVGKN